jgi:hypothetical protein
VGSTVVASTTEGSQVVELEREIGSLFPVEDVVDVERYIGRTTHGAAVAVPSLGEDAYGLPPVEVVEGVVHRSVPGDALVPEADGAAGLVGGGDPAVAAAVVADDDAGDTSAGGGGPDLLADLVFAGWRVAVRHRREVN